MKSNKKFYSCRKGLHKDVLNGRGDLLAGDRAEVEVFCAFFPFAQTSPAGSPKSPCFIRNVQSGTLLTVDEANLGII